MISKVEQSHLTRWLVAFAAAMALTFAICAAAQANKSVVRKSTRSAKQGAPIRFGNIVISNYETIGGKFGSRTQANGPNTTIDVADSKDPSAKTSLRAQEFIAYWSTVPDEKDKTKPGTQQITKVEVIGNLRYSSVRISKLGVTQTLHGTASKGIYFNLDALIELSGPIEFDARVTDKKGAVIQTAKGDAASATFDEAKQILKMKKIKSVSVMNPSLKEPAVLSDADELTLEMAETPATFLIGGGTLKAIPADPPVKKKP